MGTRNMFSIVEVRSPPSITMARGDCISLPGSLPRRARGMRARAEVSEVMMMGVRRSDEPLMMRSASPTPSSRKWL